MIDWCVKNSCPIVMIRYTHRGFSCFDWILAVCRRETLLVVHYSNARTVFTRILERFLQSSNKGLPARLLSSARWLPQAAEAAYRRVISIIGIGGHRSLPNGKCDRYINFSFEH